MTLLWQTARFLRLDLMPSLVLRLVCLCGDRVGEKFSIRRLTQVNRTLGNGDGAGGAEE